ncbi:MAG: 50S ribosomal protein L19 [Patescibacteria group bacterium]
MAQQQQFQVIKPEQVETGMQIRVHQHISEQTAKGMKDRIQVYEGLVLTVRGKNESKTMTVRKVSDGVGVERIYPLILPSIEKIELVKQFKVRRKNISFLKDKKKRMKEVHSKLKAANPIPETKTAPVEQEVVAEVAEVAAE